MHEKHYKSKNEVFSIEGFLVDTNDNIFIRYCFFLKTQMIGDLEQTSLLSPQIEILKEILSQKDKRIVSIETNKYEYKYLIDNIIDILYDDDINIVKGFEKIPASILDVNSNSCESFDSFYTFLIEEKSYDLFLSKDIYNNKYFHLKIPKGIFYKEIKTFYQWIIDSTKLTLAVPSL